jgi:hypothetical protein
LARATDKTYGGAFLPTVGILHSPHEILSAPFDAWRTHQQQLREKESPTVQSVSASLEGRWEEKASRWKLYDTATGQLLKVITTDCPPGTKFLEYTPTERLQIFAEPSGQVYTYRTVYARGEDMRTKQGQYIERLTAHELVLVMPADGNGGSRSQWVFTYIR